MMLLPPKDGVCPICATDHEPDQPHNGQSLYYQYRFYGIRGRWPTWADAVAHCDEHTRANWKKALLRMGYWSEPKVGEPIADPPGESIRQSVGRIDSTEFGPEEQ